MRYFFLLLVFFVGACGGGTGISLMPYEDKSSSPYDFKVCHGFGCSYQTHVELPRQNWKKALKPLQRKAEDAEQERRNIALVVARIESAVQKAADLNVDLGEARTFEKDQHQMDCIDETVNSSRYLAFIENEGLLHYHIVSDPIHRGFFVDGMWPHNSAAVEEIESGQIYAIDSYYSDNGKEVHVVALKEWLDEWRPDWLIAVPKPQRKPERFS